LGYKKTDKSLYFADLALASSLKHNRSLKLMDILDEIEKMPQVKYATLSFSKNLTPMK